MGVSGLIEAFKGGGWGGGILDGLNILFGLILALNPILGAAMLPWLLGIFGLVGGIILIILSSLHPDEIRLLVCTGNPLPKTTSS